MKKSIFSLAAVLLTAATTHAQTNIFPSSGKVGIGTSAPYTKLDIRVTDADGCDPLSVTGGQSNIFFSLNSDQYVFFGTASPATASAPTHNSVFMNMRGSYWNGSYAVTADSALQTVVSGNNQYRLMFKTANVERMAIDQSGNVGIGTTTPRALLHVATNSTAAGAEVARFTGNMGTTGSGPLIRFTNQLSYATNPNSGEYNLAGIRAYDYNSGWGGALALQTAPAASGGGNLVDRLIIDPNGNVGIGTTTPQSKLDVAGQVTARSGGDALIATGSSSGWVGLYLQDDYYASGTFNRVATDSLGGLSINHNGTDLFYVGRSGSSNAWFSGNVGIGTMNPTQKLSVNGTIQAKEVIVQTGWSDYVFEESYKLPALSEVEQRIKAEHHLPGIPSAQEVAEHGVSMGEMQSRLLAKIEELTLHQIAQGKELTRLKRQNEHLQQELSELQSR